MNETSSVSPLASQSQRKDSRVVSAGETGLSSLRLFLLFNSARSLVSLYLVQPHMGLWGEAKTA